MKNTVQKWGNSLAIRIPKAFADEIGLNAGTDVELNLVENTIQLKRKMSVNQDLSILLGKITPENIHSEAFNDSNTGKEIW